MTTRFLVQARRRTGLSLPERRRTEEEMLCAWGEHVKAVSEREGWMYKASIWVWDGRWDIYLG